MCVFIDKQKGRSVCVGVCEARTMSSKDVCVCVCGNTLKKKISSVEWSLSGLVSEESTQCYNAPH